MNNKTEYRIDFDTVDLGDTIICVNGDKLRVLGKPYTKLLTGSAMFLELPYRRVSVINTTENINCKKLSNEI